MISVLVSRQRRLQRQAISLQQSPAKVSAPRCRQGGRGAQKPRGWLCDGHPRSHSRARRCQGQGQFGLHISAPRPRPALRHSCLSPRQAVLSSSLDTVIARPPARPPAPKVLCPRCRLLALYRVSCQTNSRFRFDGLYLGRTGAKKPPRSDRRRRKPNSSWRMCEAGLRVCRHLRHITIRDKGRPPPVLSRSNFYYGPRLWQPRPINTQHTPIHKPQARRARARQSSIQ